MTSSLKTLPIQIVLTVLVSSWLPACDSGSCGTVHRWAVKTGTDPGADAVALSRPTTTTIAALCAFKTPADRPEKTRIAGAETHLWLLSDVRLRRYKRSDDLDDTTVIADGHGRTMIAEIPALKCVGPASPWRKRIAAVRQIFRARLAPTTSPKKTDQTVSLWGVGFFDSVHGQTGVAPNGIELHPVLGLCFGTGCDPMASSR